MSEPPEYVITYNPPPRPALPATNGLQTAGLNLTGGSGGTNAATTTMSAGGLGSAGGSSGSATQTNSGKTLPPSPTGVTAATLEPGTEVLDQGLTETDRMLAHAVRQTWVEQGSLGTGTSGVKINAKDGIVTLSGPVANAAAGKRLEILARQTRGVLNVVNQLQAGSPTGSP